MGCTSSSQTANSAHMPAATPTRPVNVVPARDITVEDLQLQRKEFWGSRIGGSREVWAALQTSAEAYLAGDARLATAILSASDVSMPNGTLELCFDELGHEYNIPVFCFTTPANVCSSKPIEKSEYTHKKTIIGTPLKLKVRVNPGDHNLAIEADTSNSIAELKTLIYEASNVAAEKDAHMKTCPVNRQRVFFLGKELKTSVALLEDIGLDETRVVQVFLRPE